MQLIALEGYNVSTIYDIARKLNVNPSTVSRALNNPEMVSEKMRRNVIRIAREIDYTPNLVASQLRTAKSNIIGVISLEPEWCWFTDMVINGIKQKAAKTGYNIITLNSNKHYKSTVEYCEQLQLAGVIIVSTEIGADTEKLQSKIPIVWVNRKNIENNLVLFDDECGIKEACEYLYSMGHKKIGYLLGPKESIHVGIRYNAYKKCMNEKEFEIREEWCEQADGWYREDGYQAAKKILSQKNIPTALLVSNDSLCVGAYDAARERKMTIGRDISVIGHDDTEWAQFLYPRLTTVQMPLFKMGMIAVEIMMKIIKGEECEQIVFVKGHLRERGSVGKI